jgi:AcrR family transcriptional regulator/DNA-binding MarR family transcriptional regulator
MAAAATARRAHGDFRTQRGENGSARHGGGGGLLVDGGHAQIMRIQRARILAAMLDVACERGAGSVTVADVAMRSGVSRRTFYELFADRDECLVAALEDSLALVSERVLPVYRSEQLWRKRMRTSLTVLLRFFDEEPRIGRLLVCESLMGNKGVSELRNSVVSLLVAAVDAGRKEAKTPEDLPGLAADGVVGAVLSILYTNLRADDREPLVLLTNSLMGMIVLPYLGVGAMRRELSQPIAVPESGESGQRMLQDPFKANGMRLTYRTVRVLMAVAENDGASNRQIADQAEIRDQGQISKLLGRLRKLGLIDSGEVERARGAAHTWRLTGQGAQLVKSIRAHTGDPRYTRGGSNK